MEFFVWCLCFVLCGLGVLGSVVPAVPGLVLIFIAALIHKLIMPEYLSWVSVIAVASLCALSWVGDFFSTWAGTKWAGATRYGLVGALIGGIIGIFLGVYGLILCPILGSFIGEFIGSQGQFKPALRASMGTGMGMAFSTVVRFLLALVAVGVLIVDWLR
jgi:uncharacterized protein YqgC (DUF456 family)